MKRCSSIEFSLSGASAFIPVEAQNGRFSVVRVAYGASSPELGRGRLTFRQAERKALAMNRKGRIPGHVWWAIAERLKNADV